MGEEVEREKGFGQEIIKAQSVSFDCHTEKACAFLFVFSVMRKPLGVLGHSIKLRNVIKLLQKNCVIFIQKQIIPSFYTLDRFVI